MALIFCEGFDKYGPANSNSTAVAALLTAGEWTTATATANIVAPLSQTGYAVNISGSGNTVLGKTLPGNYSRLIGGFRFSNTLATLNCGVQFKDGASDQLAIQFNATGTFSVRNGTYNSGTILGTSTASVTANTTHYLEFDITFGNVGTGSYQLWLDGVSILSGSGTVDTTATANNYANVLQFICGSGSPVYTIDDLYLFDATGTTNNAVLLTSPRIETQFPTGDGAVQFAVGAGIVGSNVQRDPASQATVVNQLRLRAVTPSVNCTLNAINILAGATASGAIQLRPVVYANSGSVPGSLLGSGATVVGTTANTAKAMPLTSGIALTAGTTYWIGHMCDIAVATALARSDGLSSDLTATSTFASGAPGTAPAMSAATGTVIWGSVSGVPNWHATSQNPPAGVYSYVYEATVGEEDLYTYPALSAPPSAIYAVVVKASVAKSDAGAKTVSMRMKSGATDSAGTTSSAAPATSYGWLSSFFPLDPNGSVAWTQSALNAAQSGVKVES